MALLLAVRRIEGGRPCCCHDDLMKSKREGEEGGRGGGAWPKQVSTPTRPLTRCYVALRRPLARVARGQRSSHSAEFSRAIDRDLGPRARVKNSPPTLSDLREQPTGFRKSWDNERHHRTSFIVLWIQLRRNAWLFQQNFFYSILKRDSISKLIMYRSFNILFG